MPATVTRRRAQRSTQRVAYGVDGFNRLVVRRLDARGAAVGRRVTLDGAWSTDARARLVYHLETTAPPTIDGVVMPHELLFNGRWALTAQHELALTLAEAQGLDDRLTLHGEFLTADAHELAFAVTTIAGDSRHTRLLKLGGRWQADAQNRLTFLVAKAAGGEDRLTLDGLWEVGRRHELLYRYRTRELRRGLKRERTLILRGVWDLTSRTGLSYVVGMDPESAFQFRVGVRTPSLRPETGRIVYEVGIGLARRRHPVRRLVTLFGTWKLDRRLGLSFEIEAGQGRRQTIHFEGRAAVSDRDRVSVALRSRRGEPLGLELAVTRTWLKDAELFARLTRRDGVPGIEVGGRIPW